MNVSPRLAALALSLAWAGSSPGQQPPAYKSLEGLREGYARKLVDLDRARISDLTALLPTLKGDEVEAAYRELFNLAIARDLYAEAAPAAKARQAATGPADTRSLATLVGLIGMVNAGESDAAVARLKGYVASNRVPADSPDRLDDGTILTLGEAMIQRLIAAGRIDLAAEVGKVGASHPSPAVRDHFAARTARLSMIGTTAPPLAGTDVEGKPASLADYKGKVVLVDFWATWCPPCVAEFPNIAALNEEFKGKGFVVLGVNLDAQRQDVGSVANALPIVRKFLLNFRAGWPNIVADPKGTDPTKAYGVEEIPANFLIGRDGKILKLELSGESLRKAVGEAVGK